MARGKTTEPGPSGRTSDRYFALVREFPLRPLRTDAELDRAIAIIDRLLARGALAHDEDDYLDVLSDLVEKYEDERYPIEPIAGIDALRHLVESSGKTRATVAAEAGLPELNSVRSSAGPAPTQHAPHRHPGPILPYRSRHLHRCATRLSGMHSDHNG